MPVPPSGSVRADRATARRNDLMDALQDLFLAEGFAHLTVEILARRLTCSKSTLYTVAASREQIVTAVVERFFERAAARLAARLAPLTGAAERLVEYLRGIADELRPATAAFFADVAAFAPARSAYERNARYAADRVRALVQDGVSSGEFAHVHAGFVAELVAAAVSSIQQGDLLARTGLDAAAGYDELSALVLRALAR